jgi:hypothetical protein
MTDGYIKTENILRILKLLTKDNVRLEELLAKFLEEAAAREFDSEEPPEGAEDESIGEGLTWSEDQPN